MVSWLFIIVLSYIFFGLFSLGDKLILSGPLRPKAYTFYVGVLNVLAIFLIPFIPFGFPTLEASVWIILNAVVFILGLYCMFLALAEFDVSRVMPAIGALQPMFVFFVALLVFGPQLIGSKDLLAFIVLIIGTFIVSKERTLSINGSYIKFTVLSSILFSLDYVFSKVVFSLQPFLQGLIWVRVCVFLIVLLLLLSRSFRKEVFEKRDILEKKHSIVFILTQSSGALATLLQSFAIALAPVGYLAIMNSLRGIQYIFLFMVTLAFSWLFPSIFKEEISYRTITQKTTGIVLIVVGLAILVVH
jgi:drug/metabolite transporter (DMT)-like permease